MGKVCLLIFLTMVFIFSADAQSNHSQKLESLAGADFVKTENPALTVVTTDVSVKTTETERNGPNAAEILTSAPASSKSIMRGATLGTHTTGNMEIDGYILESSLRHGVDPLLIFAQMSRESSFRLKAVSYRGARGLMQLMPATALRWGVTNIYSPRQNIEAGVKYMRWLLDEFGGDVKLALAGYNAGEGAVKKYGNQIPPYSETRKYVAKITAHYEDLKKSLVTADSATETALN
jgi:Soluble lytic murein transglycosylase and related regulatory proteins (some contain LysM/invasin domains)